MTGELDRGKEHARRAIAAGEAAGDTAGPALGRVILAEILYYEGDDKQVIATGRRNIEILAESGVSRHFGPSGLSVTARMHLAFSLARQGEFVEALRVGTEALRIAESGDRPVTLSTAYLAIGGTYLPRGDVARAIPILERGRELSVTRVGAHRTSFATMLGLAYVRAGRAGEAIPLLEEGADRTALYSIYGEPARLAPLALGYVAVGDLRAALRAAERGLDLAKKYQNSYVENWLFSILATIALSHEPPDLARALACASKALVRSLKMGTRPLSAHCHLVLGRAHRRAGHPADADEHLVTAATMYRQMEMPNYLEASDRPGRAVHA